MFDQETLERLEKEGERFGRMLKRHKKLEDDGLMPRPRSLQRKEGVGTERGWINGFFDLNDLCW